MAVNSNTTEKSACLKKASDKLDILKFFLKIMWEIKALPDKKFLMFSETLSETGKMLGGWIKKAQ